VHRGRETYTRRVRSIDLNADLGEECADDAAMLEIVTTANVAAGAHAGGGEVLDATVRAAQSAGVAIGAHPAYADRPGFGRISRWVDHDPASLRELVREQIRGVARVCEEQGARLVHVKAHGAMYHDAASQAVIAEAFHAAVTDCSHELGYPLAVMGPPEGHLRLACPSDIPYLPEAFADRTYRADGSLVPRAEPGAVLHDLQQVVEQALMIAVHGQVRSVDGGDVTVDARTLCVHGDTPGSVALAQAVRAGLEAEGVRVACSATS
jgi:UPF0271 protein